MISDKFYDIEPVSFFPSGIVDMLTSILDDARVFAAGFK